MAIGGTNVPFGRLEISHNSGTANPQLMLTETAAGDFSRMTFRNAGSTQQDYWDIAALAVGDANDPKMNFFYSDNSGSGMDYLSIDVDDQEILFRGDLLPFQSLLDIGQPITGLTTFIWDDCQAMDFINVSDRRVEAGYSYPFGYLGPSDTATARSVSIPG